MCILILSKSYSLRRYSIYSNNSYFYLFRIIDNSEFIILGKEAEGTTAKENHIKVKLSAFAQIIENVELTSQRIKLQIHLT